MSDITASEQRDPSAGGPPASFVGIPGVVVRRFVWAGYVAVIVGYAALSAVPGAPREAHVAGQALWTAVALLVAAALWMAHLHTTDVESRFWGFLSAGAVCILVGQVYYAVYVAAVSVQGPPAVSPTMALDVAAALVFLALLGSLARFRHASFTARARYLIDVTATCFVLGAVLEIWVLGPWFEHFGPTPVWARVMYSASPIVGAVLLIGTLRVILGMRFSRWESWERLLGASVAAFGVGLLLAPLAYADVNWHFAGGLLRSGVDLAWLSGIYLGMAAAVYRHLSRDRQWRLRPVAVLEPSYGWVPSVVLPAVEIIAIPIFGIAAGQVTEPGPRAVRLAVVGVLAVMLVLRTLLTIADTDTLLAGSVTDPLTGLRSHRHFQERLATEIASAARYHESLSLISLDIDDFRHVNEVVGHAAGDLTLVEVARVVERSVRLRDVVCRAGGDEVAIILPGADANAAFSVAIRVLSEVRSIPGPGGWSLTASAGVAAYPQHASDRDQLVRRSEGAKYWAKTHGKDRVTVYDPDVVIALDADGRIREMRERADFEAVRALAAAVDARDEVTQDHSRNVAKHAVTLAREVGLDDHTVLLIEYAGLLHDVGKIAVPDSILRKAGPLTVAERERMEAHAEMGERVLASTAMREILPWVRGHHERWDGTGYPDGLAGEGIPLGARILALANAYDAMRSARPFRPAMSRSAALQEMDLGLGTVFDPVLGERFIGVVGRRYL